MSDQWFTPLRVLDLSRAVLGAIELDPASSEGANERVQANRYFDAQQDGLKHKWEARSVFVNPPSGKLPGMLSVPRAFWEKLQIDLDQIGHAIFLAYSINQLQSTQRRKVKSMMDFTFCVPSKRLQFHSPVNDRIMPSNAPHANAVIYVPSKIDKTQLFKDTFKELGAVK